MKSAENRQKVFEVVREEMKKDRSKYTILPISKFGLMQITRQRVRPEQNIATGEVCPTCGGSGKITASILVTDQIEHIIDDLLTVQNQKSVTLFVHPFLYSYYTKGLVSKQWKMYLKYYKWVKFVQDTSLGITDFRVVDERGEEIELQASTAEQNGVQEKYVEAD
ncbi:MAG: ribonuclease E/G, partial [Adhaeribacter sp.]